MRKLLIASAAGGTYLFVAGASCYAAEPLDIEPVPLGASLTTGTTGTTTTTANIVLVAAPNMMGDERITAFIHNESDSWMHPLKAGIPSYDSALSTVTAGKKGKYLQQG